MIEINDVLAKHQLWIVDKVGGERANLRGANLLGADLSYANLLGADLSYADLRDADLRGADLRDADLRGADLRDADLRGADLRGADLRDADLRGANLCGAILSYAVLRGADLSGADLSGADLSGANLRCADLREANLSGADLSYATGNQLHLKTIVCDTYPVTYTAEVMQIGCQRHAIETWWEFDDKQIAKMDSKTALKFWRKWKPLLQAIIEASPAEPTGADPASKPGRKPNA